MRALMTRRILGLAVSCSLFAAAGCADLNVTPVPTVSAKATPAEVATIRSAAQKVNGLRYNLPKPMLQLTPQPDGTATLDVIYLPDSAHEYAIQTNSWFSSYTFQLALDQNRLLNSLEFKADTTAVGQQLLATTGAAEAQAYNLRAAQAVASQTAVATSQSAVDVAQSKVDADAAKLMADTTTAAAAGATDDQKNAVATDQAALASDQAALADAKQVLVRVQGQAQAVATSNTVASAATPVTTTSPTMGTAFGSPTWTQPAAYNLPETYGPVLYALNESYDSAGNYTLALKALTYHLPPTRAGQTDEAQPKFAYYQVKASPPSLAQNLPFKLSDGQAYLAFSKDTVKSIQTASLSLVAKSPGGAPAVVPNVNICLAADHSNIVLIDLAGLTTGRSYLLQMQVIYDDPNTPSEKPFKPPVPGAPVSCAAKPASPPSGTLQLVTATFSVN